MRWRLIRGIVNQRGAVRGLESRWRSFIYILSVGRQLLTRHLLLHSLKIRDVFMKEEDLSEDEEIHELTKEEVEGYLAKAQVRAGAKTHPDKVMTPDHSLRQKKGRNVN